MVRRSNKKTRKPARKKPSKRSIGTRNRVERKRGASGGTKKKAKKVSSKARKLVKRKGKSGAPTLTKKRVEEYERAESIIGRDKIRNGTKRIGSTGKLRPTKRGFARLRSIIEKVSRPEDFTSFSYDLDIRFIARNGKTVRISRNGIGIPKFNKGNFSKWNKRRERKGLPRGSKREYFEQQIANRIRGLVFGAIAEVWGKYPSKQKKAKMTETQVRRMLAGVKKQKATFNFTLNRES